MNRHPGVLAVLLRRMTRHMAPIVAMYWGILLIVYVVVAGSIALFDTLEQSMWLRVGGPPPRYWLLSMGVITVVQARVYISMGVTRRQLGEAYLALYAVTALLFALVQVAGFAPEHAIYSAAGVMGNLVERYPVTGAGDAVATLLSAFVLDLVYLTAGALIGIGFYRYRVWAGLAIIPIAVLPPIAAEAAFNAEWAGLGVNRLLGLPTAPLPIGLAVATGILVLFLAATYRVYRTMPVRPAATR
ncbi:hypothetical protein [Catenuloplanes atrovinosus]|uniref:Uncharacterized protein n=1 Tax=Catenuloplanes atrovinosus TaxID=137266 RepID=A0AAE3YFW4_9ACTN|nr:hypothetical protein [Catenuloplanes atrovinosus]MDR7273278.1 hypothetical protein [Catenuloplanes atrovinosus]